MKVAVVGGGKWGRNLIKNFIALNSLAAIVESDPAQAEKLANEFHISVYTSIDTILDKDIPAIAIATPVYTHYPLAKKALLAGKDVFVEKPMTVFEEEAKELIAIAKEKQLILMVGHLLLYQPAISFMRDFIRSDKLGKIYSFRQTRRSLGTIRKEENVLYSFGVHDLAVLNYLIEEDIDAILASSQILLNKGIADDMSIHLHYRSGIQAHIHLSWVWPIKERHLMILGEKGALRFDEMQQQVVLYRNYGNKDTTLTVEGEEIIFADNTPPLKLELQHFLDSIKSREQPRSSGEQGRIVVKLMADIMRIQEVTNDERLLRS